MIAIIDYQMGNLRSVQKGFERVGFEACVTADSQTIERADHVVLPGVGAFRDAIAELKRRDLVGPIRDAIAADKPLLGICLGLQLLFEVSYEDGEYEGLGILKGDVVRFQPPPGFKVPHMGWNRAEILQRVPLLEGIEDGAFFYFVHSYYVRPADPECIAIQTTYDHPFCAMIARKNLFATQFHPEKSQTDGLQLLRNFAQFSPQPVAAKETA